MNKILCSVIGAMWLVLFAAGSWWVSRAEAKFTILDDLHYKDYYLNGNIKAAPVAPPDKTPPVPVVAK